MSEHENSQHRSHSSAGIGMDRFKYAGAGYQDAKRSQSRMKIHTPTCEKTFRAYTVVANESGQTKAARAATRISQPRPTPNNRPSRELCMPTTTQGSCRWSGRSTSSMRSETELLSIHDPRLCLSMLPGQKHTGGRIRSDPDIKWADVISWPHV